MIRLQIFFLMFRPDCSCGKKCMKNDIKKKDRDMRDFYNNQKI